MQLDEDAITPKKLRMALAGLLVALVCMLVIFQQHRFLGMSPHKLFLTEQGCKDISNLGLALKRETSGCSVVVRFKPDPLGATREILLDDDRFITLSADMILAYAGTNEELPDTPGQQRALRITLGTFAVLITVIVMMLHAFDD